ncbi:S8 family serine peptidase [Mucilaginibacter koreensis]
MRIAHEELVISDLDLGVNRISAIRDHYPDLLGTGINVAVKEDRYDEDLDLLGRSFTSFQASNTTSGHATIMATLIGGNGNTFIQSLGAAPAVRFTSSTFARLLPDSTPVFNQYHISVQNHSYGTGIENYYGIEAVAYDQQIHDADTLMHVFSAGNIGTTTPTTGIYNGISNRANLSGTFKQAKNVLVVGGTGRTSVPEALSSNGPAYDGRVKPELVTDGEDGTSGAAALTSGTVALLQQAYKKQYGKMPSSALIKSILINSADDLGNPEVDFKTGYGQLNGLEALRTLLDGRFKSGSLTNGQQAGFQITVPGNCSKLKVLLAWNDVAAALNVPVALVNDLDLTVITPNGAIYLPWTLSTYPSADSLNRTAVRGRDSLNNTEQVTLNNPAAGTYMIQVKGKQVNSGAQAFYVAYQTIVANHFEWTDPAGANLLFADAENYLRWQSSYPAGTVGQLSISYDHGTTWAVLGNSKLDNSFYLWAAPNVFTKAMVRMTVNGQNYTSTEFTLSKPLTLNIGYNCTDGTLLHWNPQPGAIGYTIYSLKNNVLQKLSTATDTTLLIPPAMQTSAYYAVSALGSGFEGLRSYTIDATAQGVGCYIKTLLANVTPANTIELNLQVGSVLNLKSITWQKLTFANTYTSIGITEVNNQTLTYQFTDSNPVKGLQYYRAMLTSANGAVIYSEPASAVLLQAGQFTVYPNPAGSQITVLSGEGNSYAIKFYDVTGQLKLEKTFSELQNTVPLNLIPGNYIYTISQNGKVLSKGKLIKI